jgi:hypothetical protein
MLSVQGNSNIPWAKREEKAFFKGRDSSRERLELVRLAKQNPDLMEAGITKYFFFRDKEEELGSVKQTSFFDFFKVRQALSLTGENYHSSFSVQISDQYGWHSRGVQVSFPDGWRVLDTEAGLTLH